MRKTKEQKGITLIALIITIIVLLILAVVAIGAVQNDGIINYAKNARDQYGAAGVNENATIQAYLNKIQEHVSTGTGSGTKVTLTKENFGEYLGKKVTNYKTGETEIVTVGEKEYEVSTVYRLYYIDFENKYGDGAGTIYLKADNGPETYELKQDEIPDELTENLKIKNLNPALYAQGVTPPASTQENMKAVNWLTNTTNWNGLKTSGVNTEIGDKVNYVVGAPSLEMMMDSYNTHYNLTKEAYYEEPGVKYGMKLRYSFSRGSGYNVWPKTIREDGEDGEDCETAHYTVKPDSDIDPMYNPGSTSYWLASPAGEYSSHVMVVHGSFGGYVSNYEYDEPYGICPLVSLQSDVSLELEL